jgi:hypothetical protein
MYRFPYRDVKDAIEAHNAVAKVRIQLPEPYEDEWKRVS